MSSVRSRSVAAVLIAVLAVLPGQATAANCWHPPVEAAIIDRFRPPACPWCPGNRGIEYATAPGEMVRAVAAGRVTFAGEVAGVSYVTVEHRDGQRATYGRLNDPSVVAGQTVVSGQMVGRASAAFIFTVREGDRYIDPEPLLGTWRHRARLIPADGLPGRASPPPTLSCRKSA